GLLFGVVGRMVYDRTHTRQLDDLEGMHLSRALPFAAVIFTLAAMASMGLPGFSGFVAELQVLVGAWRAFPTLAVVGGFGILVGVAYTLRVLQLAFFADIPKVAEPLPNASNGRHEFEPISTPERIGAVALIGISILVGVYPRFLLDLIVPSFNSPLFEG